MFNFKRRDFIMLLGGRPPLGGGRAAGGEDHDAVSFDPDLAIRIYTFLAFVTHLIQ
jgi:hypothetical protein